jgi:taurine dioxygenase
MSEQASAGKAGHSLRRLDVRVMDAALGAEVHGVELAALDDETFGQIKSALLENVLLVFPRQSLAPADIVRIVRFFGTPVSSSNLHERTLKERAAHELFSLPAEITVVSNVKQNGKSIGALGDAEVVWHSDFSFKERPTAIRMLFAAEVPPVSAGGNTFFLNGYAAFDELPEPLKRHLSGKSIKQDNTFDTTMTLREGANASQEITESSGPSHPIISTHPETGNNVLFLGRRNRAYVNGLPLAESEALLEELWAHATQERFCYEHRWSVGDLVVWDNRCTLHRRGAFDAQSRRLLYAAQVEGHRPFEADDALSRDAHPRARRRRLDTPETRAGS